MPAAAVDALLLTPGADLRYLTGYVALPLERLTCLVVPVAGDAVLVVPRLERRRAEVSPAAGLVEIVSHDETDDAYAVVANLLGTVHRLGLANRMWAEQVLRVRAALPDAEQTTAGPPARRPRKRQAPA